MTTKSPAISGSLVYRSSIAPRANYDLYKPELRDDFWYSCGYCSIAETESTAIGFQIDHYLPWKSYPKLKNDYMNLIYSCQPCNRWKTSYDPATSTFPAHCYVIRPDKQNPDDHYDVEDRRLEAKTDTGEFNIQYLELNREYLQRVRGIRSGLYRSAAFLINGYRALASIAADQLPQPQKRQVLDLQRKSSLKMGYLEAIKTQTIKNAARSGLLDPDHGKKMRHKVRRSYLKKLRVPIP